MQQAKQADEEIKKGIYQGPLHGIPYGLKDLFAVKGYKTTWGTTPYKDQVIDEDSYVYTQLKKAGAVLCAKLSLGALAYNNKWFGGETKNPWNLKQGSSGSSAGSAASVVAGLLPFTIGTETLGSIVSPSTRCGATGLGLLLVRSVVRVQWCFAGALTRRGPFAGVPKMMPLCSII